MIIRKHKICKGIVNIIYTGKDETQLRCAYCKKQVKEEDVLIIDI